MGETRLTRSMTRDEFRDAVREALTHRHSTLTDVSGLIVEYAERAGVVWAPELTPEPTGDLSMVRVIDAHGELWRACSKPVDGHHRWDMGQTWCKLWSDLPQPVTVIGPREWWEADRG